MQRSLRQIGQTQGLIDRAIIVRWTKDARWMSSWWWDKDKKGDGIKKEHGKVKEEAAAPEEKVSGAKKKKEDVENSASAGENSSGEGGSGTKSDRASITPVLELQGAPRQPSVLALPLDRRPLFPGLLQPIQITDRAIYESLIRARASGTPYIGLFLRRHDVRARDYIEEAPSDRILNISEVYPIGTFAQIIQMEPLQNLLTATSSSTKEFGEELGGGVGDVEYHQGVEDPHTSSSSNTRQPFDMKDGFDGKNQLRSDYVYNHGQQAADSWTIVVKAHRRIQIEHVINNGPPPLVKVQHISDFPLKTYDSDTIRALTNEVLATLRDVIRQNPLLREHMQFFSTRFDMSDPHHVCNFAASLTSADGPELQEVLEAFNLETRLKKVLTLLKKEVQLNQLQAEISKQVEETISTNQRKYFLNEQLKQIKKELGLEHDDKDALLQKYRERFDELQTKKEPHEPKKGDEKKKSNEKEKSKTKDQDSERKRRFYMTGEIPEEAKKVMEDEMKKLQTLEKTSPEFNVTRAYLDWLFSLPWGKYSVENLDIVHAKKVLEADHFGLSDIKERILEFIAVGNLRGTVQGKIILLVGPPGVGKTSIGKSIAHALDREFYRFSVGGLSDVSEIKGHRRTYIGAMPGKPIQCLKSTGVSNPVILIDEIDKLSTGYRGDPASALLELLDPAQNTSFVDHYIDTPVDLSKVLFVCTANSTDTIPGPLLDRMEVLRLSGYDLPEKVEIAKRYLEPRARKDCGLIYEGETKQDQQTAGQSSNGSEADKKPKRFIPKSLEIDKDAIASLARWYCREAGVRKLEQHIERIYRKASLKFLETDPKEVETKDWKITESNLEEYVGKPRFQSDKLYESVPPSGIVMGLAWSTTGGSALYVETTCIRRAQPVTSTEETNKEKSPEVNNAPLSVSVHTTGQLGEVMKESTSIALTNARHLLQEVEPGNRFFEKNQIHLHVPEGAIPKDGPSAGVTITTALLSLAFKKSVIPDLAMTGEISLTGMVLPVGGIKEKVIAARRSGVKTIILPDGNRKDVDELPDYLKDGLDIRFAKDYFRDVYTVAFAQ